MYQRTYPEGYSIPENYSGIALDECASSPTQTVDEVHSDPCPVCEETPCSVGAKKRSPLLEKALSLWGRLPFHPPRFEGEDLLILGIAALLFFSKDGDKECALLLLILLFIG